MGIDLGPCLFMPDPFQPQIWIAQAKLGMAKQDRGEPSISSLGAARQIPASTRSNIYLVGILTGADIPSSVLYIYTSAIPNDVSTDALQGKHHIQTSHVTRHRRRTSDLGKSSHSLISPSSTPPHQQQDCNSQSKAKTK